MNPNSGQRRMTRHRGKNNSEPSVAQFKSEMFPKGSYPEGVAFLLAGGGDYGRCHRWEEVGLWKAQCSKSLGLQPFPLPRMPTVNQPSGPRAITTTDPNNRTKQSWIESVNHSKTYLLFKIKKVLLSLPQVRLFLLHSTFFRCLPFYVQGSNLVDFPPSTVHVCQMITPEKQSIDTCHK